MAGATPSLASQLGFEASEAACEQLQRMLDMPLDSPDAVRERLAWLQSHEYVKVTSYNSAVGVRVHDCKVNVGRKRTTDDEVYATQPEVRARVPRGLTLLEWPAAEGETAQPTVALALHGLIKFTGGMGDDDDTLPPDGAPVPAAGGRADNQAWARFFTAPIATAKSVVAMGKANGESGHLAAIRCPPSAQAEGGGGSEWLCVAGSKNVHIAFRPGAGDLDGDAYDDRRFSFAREIARVVEAHLLELQELAPLPLQSARLPAAKDRCDQFLSLLASMQLTFCFEFLSPAHQHVETFDFTEPRVVGLTLMPTTLDPVPGLERGCHPLIAHAICTQFGWRFVEVEQRGMQGLDSLMAETRQMYGVEGRVLYFLNEAGGVIGLVKKKAVWYIVVRACREKVRGMVAGLQRAAGGSKLAGRSQKPGLLGIELAAQQWACKQAGGPGMAADLLLNNSLSSNPAAAGQDRRRAKKKKKNQKNGRRRGRGGRGDSDEEAAEAASTAAQGARCAQAARVAMVSLRQSVEKRGAKLTRAVANPQSAMARLLAAGRAGGGAVGLGERDVAEVARLQAGSRALSAVGAAAVTAGAAAGGGSALAAEAWHCLEQQAFLSQLRMLHRMVDIQGWLGLSDACATRWGLLCTRFMAWVQQQLRTGSVTPVMLADKFPEQWVRFLTEEGETDRIPVELSAAEGVAAAAAGGAGGL